MFSVSRRTKRRRVNNELNLILKNISSTDEDRSRSKINDSVVQINCSSEEGENELALLCCNATPGVGSRLVDCPAIDEIPRDRVVEFKDRIAAWSLKNNITHVATTELLKLLRNQLNVALPMDARSLLQTPRSHNIVNLGEGTFNYFGVAVNIRNRIQSGLKQRECKMFQELRETFANFVTLSVGIDGLPISRSSNTQFWPILGKVDQSVDQTPFVIGLYLGTTKPCSIVQFLGDFVKEFADIEQSGVSVNNVKYSVRISNFICDAPARSYVKQCKSHNSYHGCERCVDEGSFLGRVVFKSLSSNKRTNESFRDRLDIDHHVGVSPLIELKLDLVQQFPLDYMHLVCLGIVRKLLYTWIKGPLRTRLLPRNINRISQQLVQLRESIPHEFKRKPRTLKELDHYKATEFRLFLLYTGPVVLREFLSRSTFRNFLRLQCSIYVLLSDYADNCEWNEFARQLILSFVEEVKLIYGPEFLSYNMHSLIHLCDDAKRNGKLDHISAFSFENYMQTLKRLLRSKSSQLTQVVYRINELENIKATVTCSHNKELDSNTFFVNDSLGNRCFLTKDLKVIMVRKIVQGDPVEILYQEFLKLSGIDNYPIDSTKLHMYRVEGLSSEKACTFNYLFKKCVLMPCNDKEGSFTCIPML
jgi:hypothetical protein